MAKHRGFKDPHRMRAYSAVILFHMGVIVDMVLTVAEVTAAAGAIAEFQLWVTHIRPSADRAAVGVGCFGCSVLSLVGAGKGDGAGLFCLGRLFAQQPACVDPPGQGDHIDHILAHKQEIVCQSDQREQGMGKRQGKGVPQGDRQIKQGKDPRLYRDDIQ